MSGFERVAVVGGGLIGGSVARRLHDLGVAVTIVDPDADARELAEAAGLSAVETTGAWLAECDLVVLANPLDLMAAVMADVAACTTTSLVIDVGSVKEPVHAAAREAGLAQRYVGAHPMGGAELSGFAHSDAELLVGVTWAVTYPDEGASDLLAAVVELLVAAFGATVVVLDAVEHDRSVALISHAPHVLANALLSSVERASDAPAARHLAAGSFRDGTRVAGRNPARTLNMLADNHAALGPVLDDLIVLLQDYRRDLEQPRDGTLLARLDQVAADAAGLRSPSVSWVGCADLRTLLRVEGEQRATVLVRRGDAGLESASPV